MTSYIKSIEEQGKARTRYTLNGTNKIGGTTIIDLMKCEPDNTSKHSLPVLWEKNGFIDRILPNYWSVEVFAYDDKGSCWGKFNPQVIPGKNKINFEWMLEATEDNRQKLLNEVCKLAY